MSETQTLTDDMSFHLQVFDVTNDDGGEGYRVNMKLSNKRKSWAEGDKPTPGMIAQKVVLDFLKHDFSDIMNKRMDAGLPADGTPLRVVRIREQAKANGGKPKLRAVK